MAHQKSETSWDVIQEKNALIPFIFHIAENHNSNSVKAKAITQFAKSLCLQYPMAQRN